MNEFKEGDYIVFFEGKLDTRDFPLNYVFKQAEDYEYLRVDKDGAGNCNGWSLRAFSSQGDWRYATDLEAAEYERLGKPFDVTTLKPKFEVDLTGRYLKALIDKPQSTSLKKGDEIEIIKRLSNNRYQLVGDWTYTTNNQSATDWEVLPEDKIKTELTIDDLVEGEIYVQKEKYLFKYNSTKAIDLRANKYLKNWDSNGFSGIWSVLRLANFSERQWLNDCIKADKFIPKNEALNSDFVLPEKWCVVITKKNRNVLEEYRKTTKGYKKSNNTALCRDALNKWLISNNRYSDRMCWGSSVGNEYAEITFDQFKKYVLKEHVVEKEESKFEYRHWYTYSKSKSILYFATQDKCAYGFNSKGRWEEVTKRNFETYPHLWIKASREEVEARLIEYAKEKYPVDCSIKYITGSSIGENSNSKIKHVLYSFEDNELILKTNVGGDTVFKDGIWAEIIKEEVKVSLKKVVHCTSQAEWDFVAKKLNRTDETDYLELGNCIELEKPNISWPKSHSEKNFQVLAFQQWLDEFGHNEAWREVIDADSPEFKVGDWVVVVKKYSSNSPKPGNICRLLEVDEEHYAKYRVFDENKIYDWDPLVSTSGSWCCGVRHANLSEIDEAKKRAAILSKPLVPEECFKVEPISPPTSGQSNYIVGFDPIEPKLDLKNTKIWIGDNPELCEEVQLRLFELGFVWLSGYVKVQTADSTGSIYIDGQNITRMGINSESYFKKHRYREITLQDLGLDSITSFLTQMPVVGDDDPYHWKLTGKISDEWQFANVSGMPKPLETNIVDKNKYFDTEKDLTLDEMMSQE